MNKVSDIKILDCTLRDGGYYTNWDFDSSLVQDYLDALDKAGIDYIELGLRNFPKERYDGPFAYVTEEYLNSLKLPEGPTYGVMVDAKTILKSDLGIEDAVKKLFIESSNSKISLVRIAAHFGEVKESKEIAIVLKNFGYQVGLNLMQAAGKSRDLIISTVQEINSWDSIDVLYFADSLGNMNQEDTINTIKIIREAWKGEIGFHAHNNMSQGSENALTAINNGCTWVDVTVSGMGRGAGNAQTETILGSNINPKYDPSHVYELVIHHFYKLQKELGWGPNIFYNLAAKNSIHPTYIQELLSDGDNTSNEVFTAIKYLSALESSNSYSDAMLKESLRSHSQHLKTSGTEQLHSLFKSKNVLLVVNGPCLSKHIKGLEQHIKKYNPIVVSVNKNLFLDESYINYYCFTHLGKLLQVDQSKRSLNKPAILPVHRFTDLELNYFDSEVIDYGLEISFEKFEANRSFCISPYNLTIAYCLLACVNAQASEIHIVGFDGYQADDPRQMEMIRFLEDFKHNFNLKIVALTPTSYPLDMSSLYA